MTEGFEITLNGKPQSRVRGSMVSLYPFTPCWKDAVRLTGGPLLPTFGTASKPAAINASPIPLNFICRSSYPRLVDCWSLVIETSAIWPVSCSRIRWNSESDHRDPKSHDFSYQNNPRRTHLVAAAALTAAFVSGPGVAGRRRSGVAGVCSTSSLISLSRFRNVKAS